VFASAGYLVVMPNPRGSTGYGQKFTDDINSDWGGKVYDDIMAVVDACRRAALRRSDRMAAAGGILRRIHGRLDARPHQPLQGHRLARGVFDLRSMARSTEELWFPIWEFQAACRGTIRTLYARWSPSTYAKDFKTPTLVIHGELDFRVPLSQGLQLFTVLQMQKVPSKLLMFPDEGTLGAEAAEQPAVVQPASWNGSASG
jgi:dipeptidyl aminopeptidase/acylaminoacyl peptidase